MTSPASLYPIAELIAQASRLAKGKVVLIAVDGGSGSGKSTLAREWKAADPRVSLVSMDDFFIPVTDEVIVRRTPKEEMDLSFDLDRIKSQVLEPLRHGYPARFQCLDWDLGKPREWKEIQPRGLILVEGVYSLRPELRGYFDLSLWLETQRGLRARRMRNRGVNSEAQMGHWLSADDWYAETFQPTLSASFAVDGSNGRILKRI